MNKVFYILDSLVHPTGYNHMFMVKKISRGFQYYGFKTVVISNIRNIKEPGVVFVSDHPAYYSLGLRKNPEGSFIGRALPNAIDRIDRGIGIAKGISRKLQYIEFLRLARQVKGKDIVIIGWNLYRSGFNLYNSINAPLIFTGEYYNGIPKRDFQLEWYRIYRDKRNRNVYPMKFAADVYPESVGNGCTNNKYLISYIGEKSYVGGYRDILSSVNSKIVGTPPFISEPEKISLYKSSMMILGLHNKDNRDGKMIGERVFESLAFGAICLTDNKSAPKATGDCAVFTKKEDLIETIYRFRDDKRIRLKLRKRGFEYIRKEGTWSSRAKDLIDLSNTLFCAGL